VADRRRLAVLGRPIAHSQSPALHAAAYAVLGLDWAYERREVGEGELAGFLAGLDDSWRGLSLTMPLKREVLPLLVARSELVEVVGAANTVALTDEGLRGFNTDVYGITRALADAGITAAGSVLILGGGATAASAIAAADGLGARHVTVAVRDRGRAAELPGVAERAGIDLELVEFGDEPLESDAELVISTLPGGAVLDPAPSAALCAGSTLFDVAYDPWPSALASRWLGAGGAVVPGIDMLLHQAVGQIRVFTDGSPDIPLPHEDDVTAAMRRAIGR